MSTVVSSSQAGALYWPVQLRRNVGVRSLFAVVLAFLVAY
ncbi:MAG: ABC transporter permease, partial [Mesorhizobium sp.]